MPADPVWLRQRYVVDRALVADIADEAGVDLATVHRWLRQHDIPPRGAAGRRNLTGVSTVTIRDAIKRAPTLADAARRLSVDRATLTERARADGLLPPRSTPDDIKALAKRYRAGESLASLAEASGATVRTVGRWLRAAGVELRPAGRPRGT